MSGVKCSSFELQRQRREKLELVGSIEGDSGSIRGLVAELQAMLTKASPGLKNSFAKEVVRAEAFLKSCKPLRPRVDTGTDLAVLRQTREQTEKLLKEVSELHKGLATAFGEKADRIGRQMSSQLAEVEGTLAAQKELLGLWCAPEQNARWEASLAEARQTLGREEYTCLPQTLALLGQGIRAQTQFAQEQEAKHRKRVYVLNAIDKVCANRGFQRTSGPVFVDEHDRGSALVMTFDTMAKGLIEFTLTLDGIHTESELGEGKCFEEFKALSESLDEMFDIKTEFKRIGDELPPELKEAKGLGQQSGQRTASRPQIQQRRG